MSKNFHWWFTLSLPPPHCVCLCSRIWYPPLRPARLATTVSTRHQPLWVHRPRTMRRSLTVPTWWAVRPPGRSMCVYVLRVSFNSTSSVFQINAQSTFSLADMGLNYIPVNPYVFPMSCYDQSSLTDFFLSLLVSWVSCSQFKMILCNTSASISVDSLLSFFG